MQKAFSFIKAALALIVLVVAGLFTWLVLPLFNDFDILPMEWTAVASTPNSNLLHKPQGMTFMNQRLILSVCRLETGSDVFLYDKDGKVPEASFSMPPEATHTSGLAWDGEVLWAVDYASNIIYALNPASFKEKKPLLHKKIVTGRNRLSAMCYGVSNNRRFLFISTYLRYRKIYVLDRDKLWETGSFDSALVNVLDQAGFSQGLEFVSPWLLDAQNLKGRDVVDGTHESCFLSGANCQPGKRWWGPAEDIEDLAWDGSRLWTSDEGNYTIYHTSTPFPIPPLQSR